MQENERTQRLEKRKRLLAEIFSWVRSLAIAVIAALLVRSFVFTPALVQGHSMDYTLADGQMMAVVRAAYWFSGPQRGDVVFCRYPGWTEDCVKRVVALPGERVSIKDSVVYIDGEPLSEDYLTLPSAPDFAEVTVEGGRYFVMGDNRSRSTDSRSVGALERKQIEGRCTTILWPPSDWKGIE